MPLPKHEGAHTAREAGSADKDADGFHPINVGYLVAGRPAPRSCTPPGIIELLEYYQIPMAGPRAGGVPPRGHYRTSELFPDPHGGPARRGAGAQRYCRQADGADAAAPERHG